MVELPSRPLAEVDPDFENADGVRDVARYCAEHGTARAVAALRELDAVLAS